MTTEQLVFCEKYELYLKEFNVLMILSDNLTNDGKKRLKVLSSYLSTNEQKYTSIVKE